ncbi:MAG: 5-carboxymethyl-2-hydroxymuconate Delta-isomerase [Gammaproteobacteria bacterium]|jgi:5-carboxymethyl-2-hydroxymuconate isomerase|nr:5-carboxymethyl-2-hydroxymuconate Delta-isomerase [Gammaproteobacteria bacterium]
MPHLIVEYSANIEEDLQLPELLTRLRDCAVATGVFPLGGIRLRGARRDHYLIADGDPTNAFVHLTARIGQGRTLEVRESVVQALFDVLCSHLDELYAERGLGISIEIQEIDAATSLKKNNLHERQRPA